MKLLFPNNFSRIKISVVTTILCCWLALLTNYAHGQSRKSARMGSIGNIAAPGQGSAGSSFSKYSYGLGSLGSTYSPNNSVLQSSISSAGSFNIKPAGTDSASRGIATPGVSPIGKGMKLTSATPSMMQLEGSGAVTAVLQNDLNTLIVADMYLNAADSGLQELSKENQEPITTFAPKAPGIYQQYMEQGEKAFKSGDYLRADNAFRVARDIAGNTPEILLSLAHTCFARGKYDMSAYYLSEAIKLFPELPLVPLRPKSFYDNPTAYISQLIQLEELSTEHPENTNSHLLLSYFRWFDSQPEASTESLSKALATAGSDTKAVETIETFWDGMVASGTVSGRLEPAKLSTPAEQPAETPVSDGT